MGCHDEAASITTPSLALTCNLSPYSDHHVQLRRGHVSEVRGGQNLRRAGRDSRSLECELRLCACEQSAIFSHRRCEHANTALGSDANAIQSSPCSLYKHRPSSPNRIVHLPVVNSVPISLKKRLSYTHRAPIAEAQTRQLKHS